MPKIYFVFLLVVLIISCNSNRKVFEELQKQNSIESYERFLKENPKSDYRDQIVDSLILLYEKRDWEKALEANEKSLYVDFVRSYPESKHKPEAFKIIEEFAELEMWKQTKLKDTEMYYKRFIEKYPQSEFVPIAKEKIETYLEEKDWKAVQENKTLEAFRNFLYKHPKSKRYNLVVQIINELENVDPSWNEAQKLNTVEAYNQFIENYPDSPLANLARVRISEIIDTEWSNTIAENTREAYSLFLQKYEESKYSDEAKDRYFILEFDSLKLLSETFGLSISKISDYSLSGKCSFTVFNKLNSKIAIYYKGPQNYYKTYSSFQKYSVNLEIGFYEVLILNNTEGKVQYMKFDALKGEFRIDVE